MWRYKARASSSPSSAASAAVGRDLLGAERDPMKRSSTGLAHPRCSASPRPLQVCLRTTDMHAKEQELAIGELGGDQAVDVVDCARNLPARVCDEARGLTRVVVDSAGLIEPGCESSSASRIFAAVLWLGLTWPYCPRRLKRRWPMWTRGSSSRARGSSCRRGRGLRAFLLRPRGVRSTWRHLWDLR